MIPEEIKKLLDSNDESDNAVGWELVAAQGVSHKDVTEYVKQAKIPIGWRQKYKWDGDKYVRTDTKSENYSGFEPYLHQTQTNLELERLKHKYRGKI